MSAHAQQSKLLNLSPRRFRLTVSCRRDRKGTSMIRSRQRSKSCIEFRAMKDGGTLELQLSAARMGVKKWKNVV
jgi:hypothetical protein